MKIILTDNHTDAQVNAEVSDDNWVGNAIDCAWNWMRYHGSGSVTVRESNGDEGNPRIATVQLELHDE